MRKRSSDLWLRFAIILSGVTSYSHAGSISGYKTGGWFFYESKPTVESIQLQQMSPIKQPTPGEQAESDLATLQGQLKQASALAIMAPTPENVWDYQQLKSKIYDMAGVMADVEMRNQWTKPDSYSAKNAVGGEGLQIDRYADNHCSDKLIRSGANSYGIYLFTAKDCKYCNAQVNVVNQFSQKYNMTAMNVSFDGTVPNNLGDMPTGKDNGNLASKFGVQNTGSPATVMLDVTTGKSQILGYGYIPLDDLGNRICHFYTKKVGEY